MLADTNIALLILQPDHPMAGAAARAIKAAIAQGHRLVITPQNLIEAWAVATRPADKNGLGFSPQHADAAMDHLLSLFSLLPDTEEIFPAWRNIVRQYGVTGKSVHDARLVAAMQVHGQTSILTFDTGFSRYRNLTIVNPAEPAPELPTHIP